MVEVQPLLGGEVTKLYAVAFTFFLDAEKRIVRYVMAYQSFTLDLAGIIFILTKKNADIK